MAGLTDKGFTPKRLSEIKADLEAELVSRFGPLVLTPGSVAAQLVGTISQELLDLWELLEGIYYSQYPNSAEGINLDNSAQLVGVTRLQAARSTVSAIAEGDLGEEIAAGSIAALENNGPQFETLISVTIADDNLHKCIIEMPSGSSPNYTVTVNGNDYTSTKTLPAAATDLQSLIEAGETGILVAVGDVGDGSYLLTITAETADVAPFSIDSSVNLNELEYWVPIPMQAVNTGPVPVLAGTLNEIITASTGWQQVDNLFAGVTGRNIETDAEFRLRRARSLGLPGRGTVSAIEAQLLTITGVERAYVRENRAGGAAIIRTNGGTYTSGSIGAFVNGVATATVPYNTDRDTTLADLATAIQALAGVKTATYNAAQDLLTIVVTTNGEPTYSIVDGSVVGTIEFGIGDTITMPGHSINVLVQGGDDADVALSIWESKPAGVQTKGDESVAIYDSAGQSQLMRFDRPTPLYAWANIVLTLHDEETFPADGIDQIKAAVVEYGDTLQPGDDYILQRLYAAIYSVPGIASATVTIATTLNPCDSPSYGSANIPVYENEYLDFEDVRVIVTEA